MLTLFYEQLVPTQAHDRQREAEATNRARRLLAVRRWEKRAQAADRQVHLARLAAQEV